MESEYKLVSVLVPVYGVEAFIERCARSLFQQTYPCIEYIFVDDCTQDGSIDILRQVLQEYPDRNEQVKIIRHAINRGLAAARNTAFSKSTGYYIMHVDSDDYIEPDTVEVLYGIAEEKRADVVVCDYEQVFKNYTQARHQHIPERKEEYMEALLTRRVFINNWGKLYTRDLYVRCGVQWIEGINYSEDFSVVPRLIYGAVIIASTDRILYHYVRYNCTSYIGNMGSKAMDDIVQAEEVIRDFLSVQSDCDRYWEAFLLGKLRTRIFLLQMGPVKNRKILISANPELKKQRHLLSCKERAILRFAEITNDWGFEVGRKIYILFLHLFRRCFANK